MKEAQDIIGSSVFKEILIPKKGVKAYAYHPQINTLMDFFKSVYDTKRMVCVIAGELADDYTRS